MIDTLYIANLLEKSINENTLQKKFRIYADEGDVVKEVKKYSLNKLNNKTIEYTNGILSTISSNITPIKNINFTTMQMDLTIMAGLKDNGNIISGAQGREQSSELLDIKQCINELITKFNGNAINIQDEGKNYTLTMGIGRPVNGDKMAWGEDIDCLPLFMGVSVVLFENGINATQVNIRVNGENLYITEGRVSKIRTADQSEFASEKGSKTAVLAGGKSIDFVMPCLDTKIGNMFMDDILGNQDNNAVAVEIETPIGETAFIGIVGTSSFSLNTSSNVGYNISLVEGVKHLLHYGKNWSIIEVEGNSKSYTATESGCIIFWGDGHYTKLNINQSVNHTYNDNKTKHIMRVCLF